MPSSLENQKAYHFSPKGVVDTVGIIHFQQFPPPQSPLDAAQIRDGGMMMLSNLIPDPTCKNQFICRPSYLTYTNAFANAPLQSFGFVPCMYIFGDYLYGLCNSSNFIGDSPFAFNLATNTALTVTGITNANIPGGADGNYTNNWTPATMALVGTQLIVTHPGFPNGTNKIGWFDITTPNAPVWHAGDLATNGLPAGAPVAVANFNGRAYYLCNPPNAQPVVVFSDVLAGTTRSNGNQALTLDDYVPLTALQTLQLQNQLGGVIQSLIVFKGYQGIYQITGDYAATSTNGVPFLTKNLLSSNMGTLAPNALVNIPDGLVFLNHDGLRVIDFYGKISPPVGANGEGIASQFSFSSSITRCCGASNGRMIRMTSNLNTVIYEWWYDLASQTWTGPHTAAPSLLKPYKDTFVLYHEDRLNVNNCVIARSDVKPIIGSPGNVYNTEPGGPLQFIYQTPLIPPMDNMEAFQVNEAFIMASGAPAAITCTVYDGNAVQLDTFQLSPPSGNSPSYALPNLCLPTSLPFTKSNAASRMQFTFTGGSAASIELGDLWLRIQEAGYTKGTLNN